MTRRIAANPDVVIYRITGAFFFGAAASIASVLDRIQDTHKALIVDFSAVPFLDSTGRQCHGGPCPQDGAARRQPLCGRRQCRYPPRRS